MALTEESGSGMVMPVSPMGSVGNGGFGGDWSSWIILLLIFGMFGNGWGNGYGANSLSYDFPWINANTNMGFQNAAVQSSLGDIQTGLCSGFAGVTAAVNGAQAGITQQMYANEIANLDRSFAAQTANTQAINTLQAQMANCCCQQSANTADLKYTIASESCATRNSDAQNTQAILNAFNSGLQSIKDQLCNDKIEQKNDTINQLRSELMYARGQASQDVQTAAIQAGQRALANEVEQYVLPTPRPCYVVQNPNCCGYGVA